MGRLCENDIEKQTNTILLKKNNSKQTRSSIKWNLAKVMFRLLLHIYAYFQENEYLCMLG